MHILTTALSTLLLTISALTTLISASPPHPLTLRVPPSLPALPYSSQAILTTINHTARAPVRRDNTFLFSSSDLLPSKVLSTSAKGGKAGQRISYLLDFTCRDYDFASYGVDVIPTLAKEAEKGTDGQDWKVEVYRVGRGGIEIAGTRETAGKEGVDVRVMRGREYFEERVGFSPLSLLKNPMILLAVVGLGFVIGMPYLMDSMDPEMRKEFEEQQGKSILSGGANTGNPLQNFDMAAWMAGKTAGSSETTENSSPSASGSGGGGGGSSGSKVRRRG